MPSGFGEHGEFNAKVPPHVRRGFGFPSVSSVVNQSKGVRI